jgi:hypothetical protein
MRRIPWTATEPADLASLFKTTTARRLRARCQAVWMAHRGRQCRALAHDLGGCAP